jgi:hypothetical protein
MAYRDCTKFEASSSRPVKYGKLGNNNQGHESGRHAKTMRDDEATHAISE